MSRGRVLIVDDEPDLCELLAITLGRMKLDSDAVHTTTAARERLRANRYDLCLTDMKLPDGDGLELVAWMQDEASDVPVAVITAHGNVELAVRALKVGAFDFVSKPLDLADLRKLVEQAIKLASHDQESDTAVITTPRLLGRSRAMDDLREMIGRVARSQAPVHITGESGTGKELVAQLIHESSPRRDGPFVPVNCGAIPQELMESELFGHKRGSFTGAIADKQGLAQAAEGGTLFLDEVADLPLHMQVKLLRLIQERAVRPLGEQHEVPVDVRILSATHKDLAALVASGGFREDLYYRVNVIEIKVPPLRDRIEDVGDLASAILAKLAKRMKSERPELSPEALRLLKSYHYPGNVRELENMLERALTLCVGGKITAEDIRIRQTPSVAPAAPASTVVAADERGDLDARFEHIERDAIVRALEQARYNKTAAAKALGISFRALRYRIKKLGIE
jgi:two-component system, NtrC family, response regulator PilR